MIFVMYTKFLYLIHILKCILRHKKAPHIMWGALSINRSIISLYMERVVRDSMKGSIAYRLFIVLGCSIISLFAVICRFIIRCISSIFVANYNVTIYNISKQVFCIDVIQVEISYIIADFRSITRRNGRAPIVLS